MLVYLSVTKLIISHIWSFPFSDGSTEALFSIIEKHVLLLEDCNMYLMRSLFNVEMGTPIESFFYRNINGPAEICTTWP